MATTNPQNLIDRGNFEANRMAAQTHKAEDFKVGEAVYPWVGTFAGSTTGIVSAVDADTQYVTVVFDDGQSPHAPDPVALRPYELMHAGELKG